MTEPPVPPAPSTPSAHRVELLKSELSGLNGRLSDAGQQHDKATYDSLLNIIENVKGLLAKAEQDRVAEVAEAAQVAKWREVHGAQNAGEALAKHLTSGASGAIGKAAQANRNAQIAEVLYGPKPTAGDKGKAALDLARKNAAQAAKGVTTNRVIK
jgi:hypothetical protein